ncbi:MAG: type II toxin-antitoxin system RelE/ParE family toxin, partial [Pseudomonadota bacterium]
MVEIVWTEEAERWLQDIHDYIAEDNPAAASKVIAGIFEKTQVLQRFP